MGNEQPQISAINAFNDNYIWALSNSFNKTIALVDPGDAEVCIKHIEKHGLKLSDILITHHHQDHVGGIEKLLEYARENAWDITIYGPSNESIDNINVTLKENDTVTLKDVGCCFTVVELPGHTLGHIAYYNQQSLFCGDTLFSAGCGRVFEGSHEQMHQSLTKLAKLPEHTLVYCAHEYTQANIAFALAVDPMNKDLQNYAADVAKKRENNQSTIPSTIGLELKINPFLRCNSLNIKNIAQNRSQQEIHLDSDVFSEIRSWKDNF